MEFAEQLSRAQSGDEQELNRLLKQWRPWLRIRAHGMLPAGQRGRLDSSDIVQTTLAEAYQNLSKFRGESRGEWAAWLATILRGQAIRLQRFHWAERRRTGREVGGSNLTNLQAAEIQERGHQERLEQLQRALSSLPDPLRQLVHRRIVEQASFSRIGEELGETPRVVRRQWMHALRLLAQQIHQAQHPTELGSSV